MGRGYVAEDQIVKLHTLFDKNLARALQIVDQRGVTCLVGKDSQRKVFQVFATHGYNRRSVPVVLWPGKSMLSAVP